MNSRFFGMRLHGTDYTEETGIAFCNIAPRHWQHIDCNDNRMAQVGPIYETRRDLIADHADYLRRAGWLR